MDSFDFLKRFWAWAVSLLGIAGGYIALAQADLGWLTFVIVGVAVLLAVSRPALDAWARLRRYPRVVADLATAEARAESTRLELDSLRESAQRQFDDGVLEGRAEVQGALLAARALEIPELIAMGMTDGELILTAQCVHEAIPVGARFEVQVAATGETKGVVQVLAMDAEAGTCALRCVRRTVEQYWEAQERRADEDPSPPNGVVLAPLLVELAPELTPEAEQDAERPTSEEIA